MWTDFGNLEMTKNCQLVVVWGLDPESSGAPGPHTEHSATASSEIHQPIERLVVVAGAAMSSIMWFWKLYFDVFWLTRLIYWIGRRFNFRVCFRAESPTSTLQREWGMDVDVVIVIQSHCDTLSILWCFDWYCIVQVDLKDRSNKVPTF